MDIVGLVFAEQERQRQKFSVQAHTIGMWMLILIEEVGEVAKAFLRGCPVDGCAELIRVGAIVFSWLDHFIVRSLEPRRRYEDVAVAITTLMEKHPENWNGPCNCQVCQSYADS